MSDEEKSRGGRPASDKAVYGEFAKRLAHAAENNPNFPPLYHGLYIAVQDYLAKHDIKVARETVRKWFHGETMPPPGRIEILARIMGVDPAWLSMGETAAKASQMRVTQSRDASAVTNVVAGLIALDGGHPAFPKEGDDNVDLHAVIKGASYAFRIASGEFPDDNDAEKITFTLKPTGDETMVLGVLVSGFNIRIFDLTELLGDRSNVGNGLWAITVSESDMDDREITTFEKRI